MMLPGTFREFIVFDEEQVYTNYILRLGSNSGFGFEFRLGDREDVVCRGRTVLMSQSP